MWENKSAKNLRKASPKRTVIALLTHSEISNLVWMSRGIYALSVCKNCATPAFNFHFFQYCLRHMCNFYALKCVIFMRLLCTNNELQTCLHFAVIVCTCNKTMHISAAQNGIILTYKVMKLHYVYLDSWDPFELDWYVTRHGCANISARVDFDPCDVFY
jgi:hypothetical protein